MARTTFDIKTLADIEIPAVAKRPLYAGVGATDLVVGYVRDYATTVQKAVADLDLEPKALRDQALVAVSARVEALSKDAKARRAAVESRVAELQGEARALPTRVQTTVNDNVEVVSGTYADLAQRGEQLITRIRRQEETKATTTAAKTTVSKAKATRTQTAKATKATARKATTTAKRTAKKASTAPKSSAKGTATAAKKTAASATKATTAAAKKVGD
ncbi:hypothetical protein GGQ22_12180 [Nocardioides sp. zg-579]|uniref:Heparin-binding hemagglutinin n=1 Tax=Nocardioides marmotae TaxID=2663857 RepID=A0A6I3JCI8_9ACTN|nr:hypothetical protein [Nocardioides marmotae]MCR6032191.1 hypothetical protein [Gordonia jinghuaiqii]MTB95838.1 hypothetical protein [Nocardioides marmotae]QKE02810.1 hypothetical protein HPC71_18355 [Nocardioides marmotae]